MHITQKKISLTLCLSALLISLLAGQQAMSANPAALHVFGLDTIAGYGTVIRSSETIPESDVYIFIEAPTGKKKLFEVQSDLNGIATLHLSDKETTLAGTYTISGQLKNGTIGSMQSFKVYPDSLSTTKSQAQLEQNIVAPGQETKLHVTLTDKYGNPIKNHEVRALSSRNIDTIMPLGNGITNEKGETSFAITSEAPGESSITVYDITAEVVLEKRPILTTAGAREYVDFDLRSVGGDENTFNPTIQLLAQEDGFNGLGGNIDKFEFEDLPDSILVNEPTTFTLTAYDNEDNIATQYEGTVHFVVKDEEQQQYVTLPNAYTFISEDLGQHVFSLGITFQQEGVYTIMAVDEEYDTITGETVIVVEGTKDTAGSMGESVVIETPLPGTYGINVQTISGTTKPNSTVKIFDNNEEIDEANVDKNGQYTFSTDPLEDGEHTFYVALVDSSGAILGTSDKITVSIDTSPAEIEKVEFKPSEANPGDPVTVIITSEPKLTKVTIGFLGTNYELTQDPEKINVYRGIIAAPDAVGEFTVDVFLIDELGNEVSYAKQGKLTVKPSGVPTEISNITTFPGDGQVNLAWNPATDDVGVKFYRIYYGTDPASLTNVIDTFDNGTTWYIPELQNGVEYFFGIVGVDTDGNEGKPGLIASAKPVGTTNIVPGGQLYTAGGQNIYGPGGPKYIARTGPGILWLIPTSLGIAQLTRRRKKKKK